MIQQNDLVLLFKDERRNYLVKVQGGRLHNDLGFIEMSHLIGKDFGDYVETNLGHKFYIIKPNMFEMVMKVKRMTQILYPKDIGMILMQANIFPGAKVIESGIGSGALTTAMANFVRPTGKVYSYERNPEFLNNARKNLEKYGLAEFVEFNNQEITTDYPQKDADFIMIDIGSPWDLIDAAYKSLKGGCRLATICPTFEQLTRTVFTMEDKGFTNIETVEILVRKILVRRGKTRPEQRMPSHTGWLVFATKINNPPTLSTPSNEEPAEEAIENVDDVQEEQ